MALRMQKQSVERTELTTKDSVDVDFSTRDNDSEVHTEAMLSYSPGYEKALIRRVDRRLLPILGALYAISLVDRVNVCS
jgi:hypothetical protein